MKDNIDPNLEFISTKNDTPYNSPTSNRQREYQFNLHIEPPEEQPPEPEELPKETPQLRDIVLPDGIQRRVIKQYLTAVLVALFSVLMALYSHRMECVAGLAISGALVYLGILTKLDYAEGKIREIAVICASVTEVPLSKITRVVFRTQDEEIPHYFEFAVPGKHKADFNPNFVYVIYFKPSRPKELLGYTQL